MSEDKTNIVDLQQNRVYAEQLRSVYMQFTPALLGTTLGALFLVALQWYVIEHNVLISWLILFLVINVFRGCLVYFFVKQNPDDQACARWGSRFNLTTILAGVVWALGVYLSFPNNNLSSQLTLALIIIGLSAGATSTISNILSSFMIFVLPMMLTLILLFLLENTYSTTIIAAVVFFTLVFVVRGAVNINRSNRHNITLRIDAEIKAEELDLARNEAIKSSQAKSDFLANMSHELRTPLHGILSYARFGVDKIGAVKEEKIRKYFSQIMSSGERLKILLDDLLDLSKLEAGKMELTIERSDLSVIIENCVSEQDALLASKHLKIDYEFDPDMLNVECDPNRIGQIVMNVLGNAIRFSPDAGVIRISIRIGEPLLIGNDRIDSVNISIADQGPGIPEAELETIFKKFLQGSKNNYAKEGTGLGLAISRELVHAHHGKLWCESEVGRGADFHFLLPTHQ